MAIDAALTTILQSTYSGLAQAVAIHPASGEVVVGGYTFTNDFPGAAGGAQTTRSGQADGFVSRFTPDLAAEPLPCASDAEILCLNDNRFRVQVSWSVPSQWRSGVGQAVPLTGDTGYFWFFNGDNVELVVKVLTGCNVNGHYWVFAGGLTNLGVQLAVTDTRTGAVKTYSNAWGTAFQPIQDTSAFGCP